MANNVLASSQVTIVNLNDGVSIISVDVEYAIHTSPTQAPSTGWQTTAPDWVDGKYIWSRTKTTYSSGSPTYSQPACITGGKGQTGASGSDGKGIKSTTITYQASASGTTTPTGTWYPTVQPVSPGQYLWTKTTILYTDGSSSTSYSVGKMGEQGNAGNDGRGIASTVIQYQVSTNGTTAPTGTWLSTIPSVSAGQYLWTRTTINYTDGLNPSVSYSVGKMGDNGRGISQIKNYYLATSLSSGVTIDTSGWTETVQSMTSTNKYLWNYERVIYTSGSDTTTPPTVIGTYSKDGEAGKGISSIVEYYLVSPNQTGITTSTSGWSTTIPTMTTTNKYLWNYEVINYTTGNPTISTPKVIGVYGNTGAAGKGIKSTVITYQASTSGTTTPSGNWESTIPTVNPGQYLWTRTIVTYTDDTTSTSYSIGKMGEQGAAGNDGKGVKSTAVTYQASTSGTTTPSGVWQSTVPTVSAGQYLWTRTIITYTDNTTSTSYSIGKMGEQGPQGNTGATGTGIQSITELYKILNTKVQQPTPTSRTGWSTTPPTWSSGMYIHTCSEIVYKNPTSTVYTTPVCDSSWEAVNEIEIGGRNLLLNSSFNNSLTGWVQTPTSATISVVDGYNSNKAVRITRTGYANTTRSYITYTINKNISAGDTICLSAYVKASNLDAGNNEIMIRTAEGDKPLASITNTSSWTRIYNTHTFESNYSSFTVYVLLGKNGTIDVSSIKVEKGNKPTDWCAALEETVSSVVTMYYQSTSSLSQTGGSWTTTLPAITANKFIWTKTVTTYAAGNSSETTPVLYQPDWIQEWGGTQTTIGSTSILSPKIFAGTKETNGTATGIAIGSNIFGTGTSFSGIAGYQKGVKTFHFKTDGSLLIGKDTTNPHISWDGSKLSIKATEMKIGIESVATGNDVNNAVSNIQVGGINVLLNSDFTSVVQADSQTSKHENAYPYNWGGYNAGITNPTTSYHAHIDSNTFGFNVCEFNESDGSRNWKAITQNVSESVTNYDQYVFSFDSFATLSGGKIFGGFYYYKTGATSPSFASGQFEVTTDLSVNKWGRCSVKVPLNNDIDFSKSISFYVYGYGFSSNAIVYIKNLKLETGNKSTGWSSNPKEIESKIEDVEASVNDNIDKAVESATIDILDNVSKNYTKDDVFQGFTQTVNSQFSQTASDITAKFDTVNKYTQDVDGKIQEFQDTFSTYIRFSASGIELGKLNNPFTALLDNEKLSFSENGNEVAYISNNKMHITEAEISHNLRIGDKTNGFFIWTQSDNGNLTLKWSEN